MNLELVVARHRENLNWLRRVPKKFRVTIYDKGGHHDAKHPLPNVGREAHTYLHHIVTRYDDLAELTVFAQGKPFDHVSTFHAILRELAAGNGLPATHAHFRWLGFIIDWDDATGSHLFQNWSKNTEKIPLRMDEFSRTLWHKPALKKIVFYPGANFIASRELIRQQPRKFYERTLEIAADFPDAAHCFERCWDRVFGVEGIPEEFRGRPLPVYLKPIRRLLDTAS